MSLYARSAPLPEGAPPPPKTVDLVSRRMWATVMGVSLGAFMAILDIQIINASLREIQGALGLDLSEGSWISTAYLIAEIIVIPLTAFMSEAFGMRNYLLFNSGLFVLASALCGFSWNLESMIAFRILQGLTGGTLIPLSFQTMLTVLPDSKKNIGLAIFGLTATLAPTLGPSVGGYLTDHYGWRSIFFINIVPGIIMTMLIHYGMREGKSRFELFKKMDFAGAFFLSVALGTLTYILEEGASHDWFGDPTIRICFLIFVTTSSLFVVTQTVREEPLLNLKLLLDRNFGVAGLVTAIAAMGLYGGVFATAVYLGQLHNYGPEDIGMVMMWIGIPQLAVMPLLPILMKKVDLRLLSIVGFLLFAFSNFLNSQLSYNYAGEHFRLSLILRAIGQPLFMIPLSAMAMGMISKDQVGNASAIYNVIRNLGGSIGISGVSTMIVSRSAFHFSRIIEKVQPSSPVLAMNTTETFRHFMIQGMTQQNAQNMAAAQVIKKAYLEAYVMSFADVFTLMAVGLAGCAIFILFMHKTEAGELGGGH